MSCFLRLIFLIPIIIFSAFPLFASPGQGDLNHSMMIFIFQIALIVFAAKGFGAIFKKLSLPSVLGELSAGVLLSPYLLGGISILFFPEGIFPLHPGSIPVSYELYSIATFSSILLLFLAGLETDIDMFLRYSLSGFAVGIGGVVFSFFAGAFMGMYFLDLPFHSQTVLFMGVVSTATSVGITARILSEKKKIDSPEGVTILSAAVVDDIAGIILLAVIVGISSISQVTSGDGQIWDVVWIITFKALTVLVIFLGLGIFFGQKISGFLKKTGDKYSISVLALGLALFVAGIFEQAGLAMIIGAYISGLALSKTDISYVVQETLHPIQSFFVPMFFVIMGMLVDTKVFLSGETLFFGLFFTIVVALAKFLGCGLASYFVGFNKLGASRIGMGMIPRGEVTIIISGIGFASGVLDSRTFGVIIMMTLFSTMISPPILSFLLKNKKRGTNKEPLKDKSVSTKFTFKSRIITDGLVNHVRDYLSAEGFYVYMMKLDCKVYHIRKDKKSLKMFHYPEKLEFVSSEEDVGFVKALIYEAFVDLYYDVERISESELPGNIIKNIGTDYICKDVVNLGNFVDPDCVKMHLESDTKEGVVRELAELFYKKQYIKDPEKIVKEVVDREKIISTGFENGFACPHARVDSVDRTYLAVGIKREGLNFDSLDKKPARLIVLMLSSNKNPEHHVQILAALASIFIHNGGVRKLIEAESAFEVVENLKKLSLIKCMKK